MPPPGGYIQRWAGQNQSDHVLRVGAVLRRVESRRESPEIVGFDDLTLDPHSRVVLLDAADDAEE